MININIFIPFPNLETDNLLLRRMNYGDINDLFEMRKDPKMNEFTDTKPDENTGETRAYIEKMNKGIDDNKSIIWAIEHKKTKRVIGSISIWNLNEEEKSGEFGYGIIPEFQGQGLMKEALLKAVDFGFDVMKLRYLEAYTEENNMKSIKLLEKCKFALVNWVDDEGYYSDRVYHMAVYRIENKV